MAMENKIRILIVDDERPIRRFLAIALGADHAIYEASTGAEALKAVASDRPDLMILDLGLPDMNGIEVTQRIREWSSIPIIIVSVQDHEEDKIAALDAGADDYLTKPFSAGELMARIRVAIRRSTLVEDQPIFTLDSLVVDLTNRVVKLDDQPVQLTPTEYDLLKIFIKHPGKVLTHRQMLTNVWGAGYENDIHLLQVNISNLRRKLEPDPSRPTLITTEPGVGYRLRVS